MRELTNRGLGILMISSELQEVIGMSDRVLVMREGRIAGEVSSNEMTEHGIMALATGGGQFVRTGGAHAFAH
jgi:ribose transport system ATP-binding protein/rhamnose transport system ATP-binding protein